MCFFKYVNLETSSVGAYFHLKNSKGSWMTYCQTDYVNSQFEPLSNQFNFDSHTEQGTSNLNSLAFPETNNEIRYFLYSLCGYTY